MTVDPHAHGTHGEDQDRRRFGLRAYVTRQFAGFDDHPTMDTLAKKADARRAHGAALDGTALVDALREAREALDVPLVTSDAKLAGSNGHNAVIELFPTSDPRGLK